MRFGKLNSNKNYILSLILALLISGCSRLYETTRDRSRVSETIPDYKRLHNCTKWFNTILEARRVLELFAGLTLIYDTLAKFFINNLQMVNLVWQALERPERFGVCEVLEVSTTFWSFEVFGELKTSWNRKVNHRISRSTRVITSKNVSRCIQSSVDFRLLKREKTFRLKVLPDLCVGHSACNGFKWFCSNGPVRMVLEWPDLVTRVIRTGRAVNLIRYRL